MSETKRDLAADLAICNAATPGPWAVGSELSVYQAALGGTICDVGDPYPRGDNRPCENMRFIAEARTGWPHAIKRALDAEAALEVANSALGSVLADVARLRSVLQRMDDRRNPMLPRSVMARIAKRALDEI